jgi:hypothetical protein
MKSPAFLAQKQSIFKSRRKQILIQNYCNNVVQAMIKFPRRETLSDLCCFGFLFGFLVA